MKLGKVTYIKSYFVGFLIFNILLLILSYSVLYRLYSFIYFYKPMIFNVLFMYNLCIAYILYRFYIEFNFSKYLYDIDPRKIYSSI